MGRVRFVIVEELDDGQDYPTGIERNPEEWQRSLVAKIAEEVSLATIPPTWRSRGKTRFDRDEILAMATMAINRQCKEFRHLTIRLP
jgi:hypothetical protein